MLLQDVRQNGSDKGWLMEKCGLGGGREVGIEVAAEVTEPTVAALVHVLSMRLPRASAMKRP
jgi:hypothetical protein